jgi:IS605 OrfB family transposase
MKFKVRPSAYPWLNRAAKEVNHIWNHINAVSRANVEFLGTLPSGYDLVYAVVGESEVYQDILQGTINCIAEQHPIRLGTSLKQCWEKYKESRNPDKKARIMATIRRLESGRLRWRKSYGPDQSLGWVPWKRDCIRRSGRGFTYKKHLFKFYEQPLFEEVVGDAFGEGCFAQDAVGDWYFCVSVRLEKEEQSVAEKEEVGIDLGLKSIATTSDGKTYEHGRWYREAEEELADLQAKIKSKENKGQMVPQSLVKRKRKLHRYVKRCRADALHKASREIVDSYQKIVIGGGSSAWLLQTRMAKSVLDAAWGMFTAQLTYKGEHAGRSVYVVNERDTTVTCSECGSRTGPTGVSMLLVRSWACSVCGAEHDRDVNAARNMLRVASRRGGPLADAESSS